MQQGDPREVARMMIERHVLRAQAVALERASEMQAKGDTAEFDRWQSIHAAICELRRTEPRYPPS